MNTYDGENHKNMTKKDYLTCPAIGYDATSNFKPAEIIDFIHGIDEQVVVRDDGKIHITRLKMLENGDTSFRINNQTFQLSNFMRK